MGTPRFSFETNCPDGQKCGATTTGCIVGHCQRKGTATCKHMLNLQAGESHVLSYACPYCKNEELESKLAALEADARRWIPVTESTPKFDQVVLVDGGIAYYGLTGKWMTITGEEWPGKPIQWKVTHWMPLPALSQEPAEGG